MNILTFSKITKPIYEGGASIDLRPRGKWLIEVKDKDGTIRRPFGDNWVDNLFLNGWADGQLAGSLNSGFLSSVGNGFSWNATSDTSTANKWTFLTLFYGTKSSIAVGSGTTAVQITDTALANQIRFDSTPFASGNNISWSETSGNIVYTIKESFPTETGSVTYNEAGIRITGGFAGDAFNGLTSNSPGNRLINRVVFPGAVSLTSGQQLILTVAVTIPSLASSAGKTITIGAQNGVDISGVLKCIATSAAMAGGTVTGAGTPTLNQTFPLLFNTGNPPIAILSNKTAFDTLGANPTWGTTGEITGIWGAYTNGNRFRDIGYQWGSGTPASDTAFRSILFRPYSTASANGGYQLLLDNEMTKATAATLSLSLRFTV